MAEETEETNRSPETIPDEPPTLDEIADAVVAKLKDAGLVGGAGAGTEGAGGGASEPSKPAQEPASTEPAAASASPAPSGPVNLATEIDAAIERALARRDAESRLGEVERKVNAPPEPKPPRTGLAAAIWGKDRA